MRRFAAFAATLSPFLHNLATPPVAVVTSQAAQFSVLADLQLEAQRKAVRALAYHTRVVPLVIAENRLPAMRDVALAILPAPQALTEEAWRTLLGYVERGASAARRSVRRCDLYGERSATRTRVRTPGTATLRGVCRSYATRRP